MTVFTLLDACAGECLKGALGHMGEFLSSGYWGKKNITSHTYISSIIFMPALGQLGMFFGIILPFRLITLLYKDNN